MQCAKIKKK